MSDPDPTPNPDPTPDPAPSPAPAPTPPVDDDDRPMTRREWKAWLAEQEAAKAKPAGPEPVKAPAPPKKDPDPAPPKKDPDPEEDYPSGWFRPRKKKPARD